jgi:hypothetical protein
MNDSGFVRKPRKSKSDGSGQPIWKNETRWARENLILDGRMEDPRQRGIWEISEKGKAWLKANPTPPGLGYDPDSIVDDDSDLG